jgi:fatty-acyl-CoA synthase
VILETAMRHPRFTETDLSTLAIVWVGGAPVPPQLLQAWRDRGVPLMQAYGLTELSGASGVILDPDDAVARPNAAGRPIMFHRVRIVDAVGDEAPRGEIGEITIHGPSVMQGYLNRPEQTEAAIRSGWLHTGDMGWMDDDGFLYLVDRRNEMLISGGINVYPAEIERVLNGVAGLGELAVIGVRDERWGQVPALVVADLNVAQIDELVATCQAHLADYKHPKFVIVHGGPLPRTLSGKLDKVALRERFSTVPESATVL